MPSWDAPSSSEQSDTPPPTQTFEAAPFAPPPGPPEPPPPPTGPPGPSGDGPDKKLVFGILGGAAAILLAIALVLVFVVIRKDEPTVMSSPTTSSATSETTSTESTPQSSSETTSPVSPAPPPPGAEGSDGDYTFSVASTETGDTITSTVSNDVETTADGTYYVIHLNVANTGAAPLTFVATFQQLNAAGQTFPLDDEATAFLGGTIASIAPGEKVETALVYDVPVGTEPDSILLRADPSTAGVELPLR
jgi:cytoskeletal protein RodZ